MLDIWVDGVDLLSFFLFVSVHVCEGVVVWVTPHYYPLTSFAICNLFALLDSNGN